MPIPAIVIAGMLANAGKKIDKNISFAVTPSLVPNAPKDMIPHVATKASGTKNKAPVKLMKNNKDGSSLIIKNI